ncbi:MAG: right-handed parallel beta-helix repeat-containing protein, partial [Candidatus Omnitrophica bacterium]|nr:right-handed parallel beta-helix repeat-containing protein [Candidatus Omnitrophota bacterium]
MKNLILTLILALTFTIPVFANGDNDNTDRLTSSQNYTFSPGYINAAKQQTDAILRKESPKKSLFDRAVEYVQSKLSNNAAGIAQEKSELKPVLQHRGQASQDTAPAAAFMADVIMDSTHYNVAIGSGQNQEHDSYGRLIAEELNGIRHIYAGSFITASGQAAGYAGSDAITKALACAIKGNIVLVGEGTYAGFTVKDGVTTYGGYRSDGVRETAYSRITGTINAMNINEATTLSGFSIDGQNILNRGIDISNSGSSLRIFGNEVKNIKQGWGIYARDSSSVIQSNIFSGITGSGWCYYGGIYAANGTIANELHITNNTFSNIGNQGHCVLFSSIEGAAIIEYNKFYGGAWGVTMYSTSHSIVRNNLFTNNYYGALEVYYRGVVDFVNNTVYDPNSARYVGTMGVISSTTLPDGQGPTVNAENNIITASAVGGYNCIQNGGKPLYASAINFKNNVLYYTGSMGSAGTFDATNVFTTQSPLSFSNNEMRILNGGLVGNRGAESYNAGTNPPSGTATNNLNASALYVSNENLSYLQLERQKIFESSIFTSLAPDKGKYGGENLTNIFKGLLANSEALQSSNQGGGIDPRLLAKIVGDALNKSALATPQGGVNPDEMEIAAKFANILGNPTEDQKVLIDAIKGLLQDMNKVEKEEAEAGTNPE